jgi:putative MFS transporter
VARLERLPFAWFHLKARLVIGTATFFDAFDALAIAFVLPALIPLWQLKPTDIGALISIGYVGQIGGALLFGWLAERRGRMVSLLGSVATYSLFSLLAAFAWDYSSLFVFRTLQGVGLGGEVPVAAAYINEIARARGRGRFVMLYEAVFAVGIFAAALLGYWVVPTLGWRAMFVIGALPALLVIAMRLFLPESPRWLANQGRLAEADRVVAAIEQDVSRGGRVPLPPPLQAPPVAPQATRWQELLQGIYRRRTLVVWTIWFTTYFASYGLTTWLPSLYSAVFRLPLEESLRYSLIPSGLSIVGAIICALLIDWTGRKLWIAGSLLVGAVLLLSLWQLGATSPMQLVIFASAGALAINTVAGALYLYSPELYPTRMRALASSVGSAWLRVASAIGPAVMGVVVAGYPLATAFLLFGVVLLIGAVITGLFAVETTNRVLEEVSP